MIPQSIFAETGGLHHRFSGRVQNTTSPEIESHGKGKKAEELKGTGKIAVRTFGSLQNLQILLSM